ncbi:nickel/cobalt transporter, partial [Bordetella petrii]|uniref:nickel/cobalt transporter n=1 Tax=Bordetella petrii TaxID=94624 RepID=UPI003AF3793C|nr:hypothetical protein [Bordetella petrii]
MRRGWQVALWGALGLLPCAAWAQGAHPFGVPESTAGLSGGPDWLSAFFGQVAAWQTHFYRQLTGAVRAWQADGAAAWGLLALSFAYGVFHALGPGHGKAVIASYVLANRQTARNGALLAFVSALLQALVAIGLVAVLAWLLNATAPVMNRATRWLEMASYIFIVALGAWLVWQKGVRPWLLRPSQPHGEGRGALHGHDHGHDSAHVHHHAPGHGHGHIHDPHDGHPSAPRAADCGCGHSQADQRRQAISLTAKGRKLIEQMR